MSTDHRTPMIRRPGTTTSSDDLAHVTEQRDVAHRELAEIGATLAPFDIGGSYAGQVNELAEQHHDLAAEVERMRPVVEAAEAWRDGHDTGNVVPGRLAKPLQLAVDAYRAQKAPQAPSEATQTDLAAQPVADTTPEPQEGAEDVLAGLRVQLERAEGWRDAALSQLDQTRKRHRMALQDLLAAKTQLGVIRHALGIDADADLVTEVRALVARDKPGCSKAHEELATVEAERDRAERERDEAKATTTMLGGQLRAARELGDEARAERDALRREVADLRSQITKLADFILAEIPGEPSTSDGAVDVAIRLLRSARKTAERDQALRAEVERIAAEIESSAGWISYDTWPPMLRAALAGHGDPAPAHDEERP